MIPALAPVVDNTTLSYFYNQFNFSVPENISGGGLDGPVFPSYIRTASMIICILIMVVGVIGNVMVPLVILKSKDMRNSTNIFLINLSLADLLVLLVCTPTVLVEVNSRPETWVLGQEMCKAVPFVELTVAHASVLTILAISFERYYAICEPLKAGYVCTKARAFFICLLAWTFAAIFTSPILGVAEYRYEEYFDGTFVPVCLTQADTFWPALFFILTISLFFALPLIVLIVLYTVIAKHLMSHPGILASSRRDAAAKYRKQVVMMLGTVVLSFFICLLPFRALTLWIIIVPPETVMSLGIEAYYNLLYFCRIMLYLNSAVNPILYNLMSSKFRDGFMKLCGVKRQGADRVLGRNGTFHTTSTTTTSGFHTRTSQDSFWRRSIISSKGGTPAGSIKMILRHGTSVDNNRCSKILTEVTRPKIIIDNICQSNGIGPLINHDVTSTDSGKTNLVCDGKKNNIITSALLGNCSPKNKQELSSPTNKRQDESFV